MPTTSETLVEFVKAVGKLIFVGKETFYYEL